MMQYRLGRSVPGSLSALWQKESTPSACEIWSSGQTATRPFQTLLDAQYRRRLWSSLSRAVQHEALAFAYGWSDAQKSASPRANRTSSWATSRFGTQHSQAITR